MTDRFDFWTHGVNVQVEYTDKARGLEIRRAGFGTVIHQNPETWELVSLCNSNTNLFG